MDNQKMTLPGMTQESLAAIPPSTINIDLDDQASKFGRAISFDVFKSIVQRFNRPGPHHPHHRPRPDECVAFVIDKQLLHLLMASRDCRFLLLAKCLRPNPKLAKDEDAELPRFVESLAFMALKEDFTPVGTSKVGTASQVIAGTDTSTGEWIQGFTHQALIDSGIILKDPLDDNNIIDFDLLFDKLEKGKIPSVND